jgi:hypothetical protein
MEGKCSEREGLTLLGVVLGERACKSVGKILSSKNPSESTYLRIVKFLGDHNHSGWRASTLVRNFKGETRDSLELMVGDGLVESKKKRTNESYSLTTEGYYLYEWINKYVDWEE